MTAPTLPVTYGDVTLIALGKLDPSAPGSHDEDYVYPIGFHTSRKHASCTNPGSKCLYHSEIVAGPSGKPHFKVTCADMSEHPYEDATPNGAWSLVFETIASNTRRSSRGGGPQVDNKKGCDLFGLTSDKIKKMMMDMEGVQSCSKLRYNKEKAAREAKEKQRQEEEEQREMRAEREREKQQRMKKLKSRKKSGEYTEPPPLEELKLGEWRCLEDDIEVVACGSEDQVSVNEDIPEGEERQRHQLHRIWELAAVQQFLRCFRSALGVSQLTTEDFHTAFLECSSALKVIHLRLLMKAGDRKRAPEMAEGDGWLDMLRDRLREEHEEFDDDMQEMVKIPPPWTQFLDKDPMPDSIHQYFELTLRERALILWWLCETLLDCEEEMREDNVGTMDWDTDADKFRLEPRARDKDGNSYWYFQRGSGIVYKEGPPMPGRKAKAPRFEALSNGHEDLRELGIKLRLDGKKRKSRELEEFGQWLVEDEAQKLQSKEQAAERAKSKAALMEMLPRKRSSRVATKEERDREEAEKQKALEEERARKRAEEEKRRKERERLQQEKVKQQEKEQQMKEEERQKQFREAERERRMRKRRRLLAKQAQQAALADAQAAAGIAEEDGDDEGEWWEIGNHVEVFTEEDWWQAVILKNKEGTSSRPMQIYVAYIGGSEDDNEWLPVDSTRVRPPSDSFWDNEDGDEFDDIPASAPVSDAQKSKKTKESNGSAKVPQPQPQRQYSHPAVVSSTGPGIDLGNRTPSHAVPQLLPGGALQGGANLALAVHPRVPASSVPQYAEQGQLPLLHQMPLQQPQTQQGFQIQRPPSFGQGASYTDHFREFGSPAVTGGNAGGQLGGTGMQQILQGQHQEQALREQEMRQAQTMQMHNMNSSALHQPPLQAHQERQNLQFVQQPAVTEGPLAFGGVPNVTKPQGTFHDEQLQMLRQMQMAQVSAAAPAPTLPAQLNMPTAMLHLLQGGNSSQANGTQ